MAYKLFIKNSVYVEIQKTLNTKERNPIHKNKQYSTKDKTYLD